MTKGQKVKEQMKAAGKDPVLLVQLSDSHLFADANGSLLGLNTARSLQQVIDLVSAEQPSVDVLLATGDLAQDGSVAAYQYFRQATAALAPVARWIPGNHDDVQQRREAAIQSRLMEPRVDVGNWRITFEFQDGNAYVLDYEDYH